MQLIYLDESGTCPLTDKAQPFYVLTAVCIDESKWREFDKDMRAVLKAGRKQVLEEVVQLLPRTGPMATKWARLVKAGVLRKGADFDYSACGTAEQESIQKELGVYLEAKFEVHAEPLLNARGVYLGVSRTTRDGILDATFKVLEAHRPSIIAVALDKPAHDAKYETPWPVAEWTFNVLVELIDIALCAKGADARAVLIADQSENNEGQMKKLLRHFQQRGTKYMNRPITRVLDNVHFTDSVHSTPVQAADVCSYFIRHSIEKNANTPTWQERVLGLAPKIKRLP